MKSSHCIACKSLVFCGCENCSRQPRPSGTEEESPVTLFTQTYNAWNWRWESLSPSPSLTRSIVPQGLPTHHFPITQAGDSSTSRPGKVSVGVMKLTVTQISCTFSMFSFPLSHSITSKHHSESIFSFLWLSIPFLCLPKSHETFLCMMWFSPVNVVLGPF